MESHWKISLAEALASARAGPPVKVLHCIFSLVGGGAENQLRLLIRASAEAGMQPAVFCVDRGGMTDDEIGCRVFQFRRRSRWDPGILTAIRLAAKDFRPHILHAWLPSYITMPAMLVATALGIKCVFSYRTAMAFRQPRDFSEYVLMLACADAVIANNPVHQSRSPYRWAFGHKRGREISNAVDPAQFRLQDPCRSDGRTILFVGRIGPEKNWRCLVRAMDLLRRDGEYRLVICGSGPEEALLHELVRGLRLERCVTPLGFRKDVPDLMHSASVLVLPSFFEGTPNVALEAAAAGLPMALSDIYAHRRFVEAGVAMTFPVDDPRALADLLRRLLTDHELATRMRQAGAAFVNEMLPARLAAEHAVAYRALLQQHRAARA